MKLSLNKAAASVVLAGALLFGAPAIAQAYVPTSPDTVTVTVTQNGPVVFEGFQSGVSVTITLVGRGVTGANIATANLPVTSASVTKAADASGTASATVTLPANPSGSYTVSATGPRAAGGGTGNNAGAADGNALPATGVDSQSMLGIWIGGGVLLAAGATVAVAAKVRRTRTENDA